MGNSEVGHLNIGAGRIVAPGPGAHRRRRGRRLAGRATRRCRRPSPPRARAAACCTWPASSRTAACTRTSTTCARSSARRSRPACRAWPCTPSRTAATSRRTRRPACSRQLEREWAGTGATIATVIGRYYAMDRDHRVERTELARAALVDGVGERAASASAAVEASYAARPDGRVRQADRARRSPACASRRAIRSCSSTSAPTARARSATRCAPTLGLLVTMTRYDDTLGALVAFDDAPLHGHARRRARGGRPAPAARGRDREVRPRDLLLRRRPRAAARRRGLGADPLAPRRADLRPRARDVGRGRRAALRRALRATATRSPSSTSPTPTWSGTRGVLPAVIAGVEASDAALGVILAAVEQRRAASRS